MDIHDHVKEESDTDFRSRCDYLLNFNFCLFVVVERENIDQVEEEMRKRERGERERNVHHVKIIKNEHTNHPKVNKAMNRKHPQ